MFAMKGTTTKLLLLLLFRLFAYHVAAETSTRLERYVVNTTIAHRFARTHIVIDAVNEGECPTVMGLTLQLPLNARVKSMTMDLSEDCTMDGVVQSEADAKEYFDSKVQQGSPAALLQAYDLYNYVVEISIPPLGATRVELELEELLRRKRGEIEVSIPLFPGVEVEELLLEVAIEEQAMMGGFQIENLDMDHMGDFHTQSLPFGNNTDISTATTHLEFFNVLKNGYVSDEISLPRILRGSYDAAPLPEDGIIIPDSTGTCFVHLFNPPMLASSDPLPRNVVFVIDISGSMKGQKLLDAKAAFVAILDSLADQDNFAIHSFSDAGTEDAFGPNVANKDGKEAAKTWVNDLTPYGGTNLEKAYTDGIARVQEMMAAEGNQNSGNSTKSIPIVMVLTDGQPSNGRIDSVKISRSINKANSMDGAENAAKLYGLAFGAGADFSLLTGISLQNQGRAIRIFEEYGDASTQIENFFESELGTPLVSDVNVFFQGTVKLDSQTQTSYPVFSKGSEIAVRALTRDDSPIDDETTLYATANGYTAAGVESWTAKLDPAVDRLDSECFQSFAHAKIEELLRFRDAAETLGNEMSTYATYYLMGNGVAWNTADNIGGAEESTAKSGSGRRRSLQGPDYDLVNQAESQALKLALQAGVVWPRLTAMVTEQSGSCSAFKSPDTQVCHEGDRPVWIDSSDNAGGGASDVLATSAAHHGGWHVLMSVGTFGLVLQTLLA